MLPPKVRRFVSIFAPLRLQPSEHVSVQGAQGVGGVRRQQENIPTLWLGPADRLQVNSWLVTVTQQQLRGVLASCKGTNWFQGKPAKSPCWPNLVLQLQSTPSVRNFHWCSTLQHQCFLWREKWVVALFQQHFHFSNRLYIWWLTMP